MAQSLIVTEAGFLEDSRSDDTMVAFEIERPGFESWLHTLAITRYLIMEDRRPTVGEERLVADDLCWCLFRERVRGPEHTLTFKSLVRDMSG